jgi:hypothetical protein
MSDDQDVRRALDEARAQKHHFVFVPDGASPAVVEALRALAEETGREFMSSEVKSPHEDFVRGYLNRDRPRLRRGDDRAFLRNLKGIARGDFDVD